MFLRNIAYTLGSETKKPKVTNKIESEDFMSANNWGICPHCKKVNEEADKSRILALGKKYGIIPGEEYVRLAKKVAAPTHLGTTLREDYEIGVGEDGEFCVSYKCSCSICGFVYCFQHKEQLKID